MPMLNSRTRNESMTIVGLIVVMCALFLAQQSLPLGQRYGAVPVRILAAWRALWGGAAFLPNVRTLATTVTACFLHADAGHIGMNLVLLWAFGSLVSRHVGRWWALGLFFFCGTCGNVAHTLLNPGSEALVIGSSGAVSGFEGLYLGLALRWRLEWADVWPIARPIPPLRLGLLAVFGFAIDVGAIVSRQQSATAFGAHVGGFFAGLLVAAILTDLYATEDAFRDRGGARAG